MYYFLFCFFKLNTYVSNLYLQTAQPVIAQPREVLINYNNHSGYPELDSDIGPSELSDIAEEPEDGLTTSEEETSGKSTPVTTSKSPSRSPESRSPKSRSPEPRSPDLRSPEVVETVSPAPVEETAQSPISESPKDQPVPKIESPTSTLSGLKPGTTSWKPEGRAIECYKAENDYP